MTHYTIPIRVATHHAGSTMVVFSGVTDEVYIDVKDSPYLTSAEIEYVRNGQCRMRGWHHKDDIPELVMSLVRKCFPRDYSHLVGTK